MYLGALSLVVIRYADIQRLALSYRVIQRKGCFLYRRFRVGAVVIIDIHIFQSHTPEGLVERGCQVLARAAVAAVRTLPHGITGFCGNTQLVPVSAKPVVKYAPEVFLGGAVVRVSVIVREVKVRYAEVKGGTAHLLGVGEAAAVSEIPPQSQRYRRELQSAFPAAAVDHFVITFVVCFVHSFFLSTVGLCEHTE